MSSRFGSCLGSGGKSMPDIQHVRIECTVLNVWLQVDVAPEGGVGVLWEGRRFYLSLIHISEPTRR